MRCGVVLCLLISLCASANGVKAHRSKPLDVIVHAQQGSSPNSTAPIWTAGRPHPPIRYHDTPSYDDPSKYGGGEARPIR
jgi:hypothetical protein